jgi:general secretion pathway protein G
MPSPARVAGFTLLEILIVVTIIGVLTAVLASNLLDRARITQLELASTQIVRISGVLDLYQLDNGSYPTTDQGLAALVSAPTRGPLPHRFPARGYARSQELLDPWKRPLVYLAPGQVNSSSFDLCSLGPDAQLGGDGSNADICNYDPKP